MSRSIGCEGAKFGRKTRLAERLCKQRLQQGNETGKIRALSSDLTQLFPIGCARKSTLQRLRASYRGECHVNWAFLKLLSNLRERQQNSWDELGFCSAILKLHGKFLRRTATEHQAWLPVGAGGLKAVDSWRLVAGTAVKSKAVGIPPPPGVRTLLPGSDAITVPFTNHRGRPSKHRSCTNLELLARSGTGTTGTNDEMQVMKKDSGLVTLSVHLPPRSRAYVGGHYGIDARTKRVCWEPAVEYYPSTRRETLKFSRSHLGIPATASDPAGEKPSPCYTTAYWCRGLRYCNTSSAPAVRNFNGVTEAGSVTTLRCLARSALVLDAMNRPPVGYYCQGTCHVKPHLVERCLRRSRYETCPSAALPASQNRRTTDVQESVDSVVQQLSLSVSTTGENTLTTQQNEIPERAPRNRFGNDKNNPNHLNLSYRGDVCCSKATSALRASCREATRMDSLKGKRPISSSTPVDSRIGTAPTPPGPSDQLELRVSSPAPLRASVISVDRCPKRSADHDRCRKRSADHERGRPLGLGSKKAARSNRNSKSVVVAVVHESCPEWTAAGCRFMETTISNGRNAPDNTAPCCSRCNDDNRNPNSNPDGVSPTLIENDSTTVDDEKQPPTRKQLRLVLITSCIPFIGFGFVDNSLMILLGDCLDTTLCVRTGFSTLAAAAWGNLISDLLGIKLGEYIELLANRLKSLRPNLSNAQISMRHTRRYYYGGCTIGMIIGCLLGMCPLLFLDTQEAERRKNLKARDILFDHLSKSLASYLKADTVIFYIVERKPRCLVQRDVSEAAGSLPSFPVPDDGTNQDAVAAGAFIEDPSWHPTVQAIRDGVAQWFGGILPLRWMTERCRCEGQTCPPIFSHFVSKFDSNGTELLFPLNHGIPGRVLATRKVINYRAPEMVPVVSPEKPKAPPVFPWWLFPRNWGRQTVVDSMGPFTNETAISDGSIISDGSFPRISRAIGVPIFGANGDIVGVLEVRNPTNKENFTRQDKELLLSISSHIAVEIEGKRQHIKSILAMCRRQVKARRDTIKLPTSELLDKIDEENYPMAAI